MGQMEGFVGDWGGGEGEEIARQRVRLKTERKTARQNQTPMQTQLVENSSRRQRHVWRAPLLWCRNVENEAAFGLYDVRRARTR